MRGSIVSKFSSDDQSDIGLAKALCSIDIPSVPTVLSILPRANVNDGDGRLVSGTNQHTNIAYHNAAHLGVAVTAGASLLFCALLAGLTLAICGLDETIVQLRTATGTAKERQEI
jgi:hypothetical protein